MQKVVVTGGAGTCGQVIINELLRREQYAEVWSVDVNEEKLFFQAQSNRKNIAFYHAMVDIRDRRSLENVFHGADAVIHCAAYKNVPMCETSPESCISTNIDGTQNVIDVAIAKNVGKVIFTSSDKAVNSTNVMGATKFLGEKLIISANIAAKNISRTIFSATRFGNVVGSSGSVLPIMISQLRNQKKLTVTDKKMSRFMMSQASAAQLVVDSLEKAKGGEIFITKMPVINIDVFAKSIFEIMKEKQIIASESRFEDNISYIGSRLGEKLYEELMFSDERERARDVGDFFVVLPPNFEIYGLLDAQEFYNCFERPSKTYNSFEEHCCTLEDTKKFITTTLNQDEIEI